MDREQILEEASRVLRIEAEGVLGLVEKLTAEFVEMIEAVYNSRGRVIVAGIGKSGIVGRKIVATLNSTGTRALFLHPVEAMHGDLGIVSSEDIFLALSSSGETDELNILMPSIKSIGLKTIAFTGNRNSTLAKQSDIVIDVGVKCEACPLGLAPTASSTAMLAMGDALAVVLINMRKFNRKDFQRFHPGGALGQRLASSIADIMLTDEHLPLVPEGTTLLEAIKEVDRVGLGVVFITARDGRLSGIITDGDIRRYVADGLNIESFLVDDVMTKSPRSMKPDVPAYDALNLMEEYEITVLPIVDESRRVIGILHLHDILGKGEFKFNGSALH